MFNAARPPLKILMTQGLKRGASIGTQFGDGYGAASALEYDKPFIRSAVIGAGMGAALGGGLGGVSPLIGAGFRSLGGKMKPPGDKYIAIKDGDTMRIVSRIDPETGLPASDDLIKKSLAGAETAVPVKRNRLQQFLYEFFTSGDRLLEEQGRSGKAMSKMIQTEKLLHAHYKGKWMTLLEKWVKPITDPKSQSRIVNALENKKFKSALADDELKAFNAIDQIRREVDAIARTNKMHIIDERGNTRPWAVDVDSFYHRMYTRKEIGSKDFKARAIEQYIKKEGLSPSEAEKKFQRWSEDHLTRRADFEHSRRGDFKGYIRNPYIATVDYVHQASRRMAEVQTFGQKSEKLKPLFDDMAKHGFDTKLAQSIYDKMYSTTPSSKVVEALMKFQLTTKLSLGFFINTVQNANQITAYGFKPMAKTIKDYILHPEKRKHMKDIAFMSDAYEHMIMLAEVGGDRIGGLGQRTVDFAMWGFKKIERMNRYLSANSGEQATRGLYKKLRVAKENEVKKNIGLLGEEMYQVLSKDFSSGKVIRQMERLGLNVRRILKSDTPEQFSRDLETAAYKAVENTQFRIDAMNLPPMWRSDWGRVLMQFKSFCFMQTKFIRDEIIKELGYGNIAPALRFMVSMPVAYGIAMYLRDIVVMKNNFIRKKLGLPPKKDYLDTFQHLLRMSGTLPGDVLSNLMYVDKQMQSNYQTAMEKHLTAAGNILGPTGGDVANLLKAGVKSGEIEKENRFERPENQLSPYEYPYGNFLASKVPYIGPGLKNTFFDKFPKRRRQIFRQSLKEAIISGNLQEIQKIMMTNPTLNGMTVFKQVLKEVEEERALSRFSPQDREIWEKIKERKKEVNYIPLIK